MKKTLRALCLFCIILLLPFSGLSEAAAPAPSPDVRVHLRRLGLTDRIDLTTQGRYLLKAGACEMLLPEGAVITVQLRENQLFFFSGNTSLALGTSASFLRQESGGETQLTIAGQAGAYPGDLTLSISEGKLFPVLTLSLEDYLLGVVPYEMSEYFPLEALKAQAVCARTYALARSGSHRGYDVVDTTDDQVFRGKDASAAKAAQAIRETAGLVITFDGKLAEGYYSASNGGQTELPSRVWSGDAAGCYAVTDDPYDVENPESVVRQAELKKDGSNLYKAFLGLLRNAVLALPEMREYSSDEDAFRVDSFEAMEVTSPRYEEPCRLMTRLRVTLSVSARKPAPDADSATADPQASAALPALGDFESAGTHTVTLNLFPDVLYALGISVSGAGNEIITVVDTGDAFRLEARRYGHGVGLSQRGAQWMASAYSMGFEEILAFYYPGMELKRVTWGTSVLPTPNPRLAETPGPLPTPTPRPTLMPVTGELPEGAWLASVEGIGDDSSLNLREEPSAGSKIVMRLYKHQRLIVLEDDQVPGWARVRTDAIEGFVMVSFLERISN